MTENEHDNLHFSDEDNEKLDFADLEQKLNAQLENEFSDLKSLQEDFQKIENPAALGNCIKDVIWDQFLIQIGVNEGSEFIKENRNLRLDLRKSAHTQTTENFEKKKLATHNPYIDYQKRYDDWQNNFARELDGRIRMNTNRATGKTTAVLRRLDKRKDPLQKNDNFNYNARAYIDADRPSGSVSMHMDHTIPAAEIIRDPEANAHLSRTEHAAFANSEKNLNLLDGRANESKGDQTMAEWLASKRYGQTPGERFPIDENKLRQKDKEAREEYERVKKEGERRSIKTGKQSRKEEAFRIGGSALRAAVMTLLADFVKTVIKSLIQWFLSAQKTFSTLLDKLKNDVKEFVLNLKERLLNVGETLFATIFSAIKGPFVGTIKRALIFIKQGLKSIKDAVVYLKDPQNKDMPFSQKLMQVGKIVVAGIAAGGAVLLGEVIEKGLMTIPVFNVQIPLLGSLANILGIFFGAIVSGIVGAIALNLIDKAISNKQKQMNQELQIDKKNEIIKTQSGLIAVSSSALAKEKEEFDVSIKDRHASASNEMNKSIEKINQNAKNVKSKSENDNANVIDKLNKLLDNL